eukprot:3281458-Prymnesium_polylepis.1
MVERRVGHQPPPLGDRHTVGVGLGRVGHVNHNRLDVRPRLDGGGAAAGEGRRAARSAERVGAVVTGEGHAALHHGVQVRHGYHIKIGRRRARGGRVKHAPIHLVALEEDAVGRRRRRREGADRRDRQHCHGLRSFRKKARGVHT